jgi:hypothetical protein
MIDLKITVKSSGEIANIKKQLQQLPTEAFNYFKSITPRDTGNARRRTKLTGTTIKADYVYAQPLDEGHSRQAPDGMIKPTEKWLQRRIKQIKGK